MWVPQAFKTALPQDVQLPTQSQAVIPLPTRTTAASRYLTTADLRGDGVMQNHSHKNQGFFQLVICLWFGSFVFMAEGEGDCS